MKKINLVGKKFGSLRVKKFVGTNKWNNCMFLCKCGCGNTKIVVSGSLRNGGTTSCGCQSSRNFIGERSTTHGFSRKDHPESFYNRFCTIKARCNNPKNHKYKDYGGRGIKNLWESFEEFKNDMYESYLEHVEEFGIKNTSIDRIDVDGHYEKSNCRWATYKEQANNKRKQYV